MDHNGPVPTHHLVLANVRLRHKALELTFQDVDTSADASPMLRRCFVVLFTQRPPGESAASAGGGCTAVG